MLWKVVLIFLGGVLLDLLVTKYTRCVAMGQPKHAAALSGIITLANIFLWGAVLQTAEPLGMYGAFAMASGATVGTFLGFKQRR